MRLAFEWDRLQTSISFQMMPNVFTWTFQLHSYEKIFIWKYSHLVPCLKTKTINSSIAQSLKNERWKIYKTFFLSGTWLSRLTTLTSSPSLDWAVSWYKRELEWSKTFKTTFTAWLKDSVVSLRHRIVLFPALSPKCPETKRKAFSHV